MIIDSNLIELKDGIYSFSNGECIPHCEWARSLCISCVNFWPNFSFTSLSWPETGLSIVKRLIPHNLDIN